MIWKSNKGQKSENLQILGNFNFHVDVSIKGQSCFQSCSISINIFSKEDKRLAIASRHKWFRVKGDKIYQLVGINSNTYQCSAQDIGSTLKIEVTSQEEEYFGVATILFGPINMDSQLKQTLEGILATGGTKFPINQINLDDGSVSKEPDQLLITNEYIRLIQTQNKIEKSVQFKYCIEFPIIEVNYLDVQKFAFLIKADNEDYEKIKNYLGPAYQHRTQLSLAYQTTSRNQRDLIILAIKCFAVKNYLQNSKVINNIDLAFEQGKLFSIDPKQQKFMGDLLLEIDSIKKELNMLIELNKELQNDKENQTKEIKRLEEELQSTIETFTQIIQEIKQSGHIPNESVMELSMIGQKNDQQLKKKVTQLEEEKKALQKQIMSLKEENQIMQNLRDNQKVGKNEGFFEESRFIFKDNDQSMYKLSNQSEGLSTRCRELEKMLQVMQSTNEDLKAQMLNQDKQLQDLMKKSTMDARQNSFTVNNNNQKLIEQKYGELMKLNESLLQQLAIYKDVCQRKKIELPSKDMNSIKLNQQIIKSVLDDIMQVDYQNNSSQQNQQAKQLDQSISENQFNKQKAQFYEQALNDCSRINSNLKNDIEQLRKEYVDLKLNNPQKENCRTIELEKIELIKQKNDLQQQIIWLQQKLVQENSIQNSPPAKNVLTISPDRLKLLNENEQNQRLKNFMQTDSALISPKETDNLQFYIRKVEILEKELTKYKEQQLQQSNLPGINSCRQNGLNQQRLATKPQPFQVSQDSLSSSLNVSAMKEEISKLQNKIQLLEQQINALQLENESLKDRSVIHQSSIMSEDVIIRQFEERVEEAKRLNVRLQQDLEKFKKRNQELERENDHLKLDQQVFQYGVGSVKHQSITITSDKTPEQLQADNDLLLQQRNQLAKKVESLQKELESKGQSVQFKAQLDGLVQTNQRLMQELAKSTEYNNKLQEEIDLVRNSSRIDGSMISERNESMRQIESKYEEMRKLNDMLMIQMSEMQRANEQLKKNNNNSGSGSGSEKKRRNMQQENSQTYNQMEKDLEEYKEKCATLERQMQSSNEKGKFGGGGGSDSKSYRQERDNLKAENEKLKKQMEDHKTQLDGLLKTNNKLIQENSELAEKNKHMNEELEELHNKSYSRSFISETNKELDEARRMQEIYRINTDTLKRRNEELERENLKLKSASQLQSLTTQNDKSGSLLVLELDNQKLKQENSQLRENLTKLNEQLDAKQKIIQQLTGTNTRLVQENMSLTDEVRKLKDEIDMKSSFISGVNKSFDRSLSQGKNSNIASDQKPPVYSNLNNFNQQQVFFSPSHLTTSAFDTKLDYLTKKQY